MVNQTTILPVAYNPRKKVLVFREGKETCSLVFPRLDITLMLALSM
jgi:hypothetical protein